MINSKVQWLGPKVWQTALVNGLLLNLFGWMGNAIVLNGEWRRAESTLTPISTLNITGPLREAMSLAPDFIYGYLMVIIYQYMGMAEGFGTKAKVKTILISFLFGLFTTYLGLVVANLIPVRIAVLTTGWGLLTFFPAFMISIRSTKFDQNMET